MAALAKLTPKEEANLESVGSDYDRVIRKAAELYGSGHSRRDIARLLAKWLDPTPERPMESKITNARAKLRRLEQKQWFRDLVWDAAVIELDMSGPEILKGIARKAKKGRVDAAKLAFAITGRHRDHDDDRPGQIQINIGAMPRPAPRQGTVEQPEVEIYDAEYTEEG